MNMYYIAIVLPYQLDEKVKKLKQYMFDKYNCKVGLKSPAHITIMPPFWEQPEKEADLIQDLDHLSDSLYQFQLETAGFSAFKPRTIFIAVKQNEHLNRVKKQTDDFFDNKDYKIKKENRLFHPHITIATRDLFKKDFAEAWPYFENMKFEESWMAEGLSLLRHNKKNWDVIHTSQFKKI
jgi:2'-5' RNA ligase